MAGLTLTGINQAWVADITYIRILKGFVFLAALLDRYSCKVIGWAISKRIDAELCLAASRSPWTPENRHPGVFTIPIAVCSTLIRACSVARSRQHEDQHVAHR